MEKRKTGKYLKYAIGEIILVVIGILIALSINNWNEKRKTEEKTHQFLLGLKTDLQNDLEAINYVIKIQNSRFNAINELIDFSRSPNVRAIIENDTMKASQGGRNFTFFPVVGSYKAASNNGLIDNIKDEQLKNNILNLYEHLYVRVNYNGEISDNRYEKVDWESRRYIDYTKKELVFDKRGLLDNDFVNQLGFLNRFVRVYIGRCDDTKLAIETTLNEINNYLIAYD